MKKYDHSAIEGKWQKVWKTAKLYQTPDSKAGKDNFYLLVEFPYPSGNLHVGHWYAFAVPDILARHLRMKGKNVLYPIGFDAFGLPAENAAIKNKLNPRKWTEDNIAYMKKQIASMGTSFDLSREVQTIDPAYYKWTQWMFLQLFKAKLAYRKETAVNWCPKDKTVLANEQVIDGKCERCDSLVDQKQMLQWNLKITDYADRLIDDLETLDWPEEIKQSQRNWIGRSEGIEIDFPLVFDDDKKYKYVILHGFKSRPDKPKWLWLKGELEKMGHQVIIPALPNPDEPSEDEQVAAALAATSYDENTVLLGSSLGCVVAMKVAEKLHKPIARLVLSGGFADRNFKDKPRNFDKQFSWKFDGNKIRANVKTIQILHDPRDYAVSEGQLARLEELLGVKAQLCRTNGPHFTGDTEPDILMWLRPTIRVFTTRADTLFGATYLVLAPEHQWVAAALRHRGLLENEGEIERYIATSNKKTELERQENREKTGVELKGVKAINPATGEHIPLWTADFVIGTYGTGAVFADAHDERDFEFAKKFNIPLKTTLKPADGSNDSKIYALEVCFSGRGILYDSGEFSELTSDEAIPKIGAKYGRMVKQYRLRDWIVSRQRYWGVPIPIVHCPKCDAVPVPEQQLPVLLPDVKDYLPTGDGKSPLAKVKSFVNTKCPSCGGKAERETDTLDTFVDSSWYFLRYTDPKNKKEFAARKKQDHWMPVDLYSGGAEHTTMHLLYSRFWHKALFDLGLVADAEPYKRRMNRSVILGPDNQKMSKSRGNVVDPDEIVKRLGADTVRMYLAFVGPYNEVGSYPWNPDGVVGVRRFLERVWRAQELVQDVDVLSLQSVLHKTIKKVGDDCVALKFNTAISALMIFLNAVEKEKTVGKGQWQTLLKLLAPFAPHMAEELWQGVVQGLPLDNKGKGNLSKDSPWTGEIQSVHTEAWPQFDPGLLVENEVTIAIQINGKTRGEVRIPTDEDKATVEKAALDAVAARLGSKKILRTIVVPGRLVNFVVEE
ncbi:MAG TPA: leucine--tRNA ligase [Candidatus Paceibacterota bacterium]